MDSLRQFLIWIVAGLMVGLLVAGVRQCRDLHMQILRLQQKLADERSAHYVTYRRLERRQQRLGALQKQIEAMAEIAQGSAQLAQLYEAMSAEARWADSTPALMEDKPPPTVPVEHCRGSS